MIWGWISAAATLAAGLILVGVNWSIWPRELLPDGYVRDTAMFASIGLGLLVIAPVVAVLHASLRRARPTGERSVSWARLTAAVPGVLLLLAGGILSQYLGWDGGPNVVVLAMGLLLALGVFAAVVVVVENVTRRRAHAAMAPIARVGLVLNVLIGGAVGLFLVVVGLFYGGDLRPQEWVFAGGSLVAAAATVVMVIRRSLRWAVA